MLKLLPFQLNAVRLVKTFNDQFNLMHERFTGAGLPIASVGSAAWSALGIDGEAYSDLVAEDRKNIPNCCLAIPTGGGKTITGLCSALELSIANDKPFIVWLVPSDAIYQQVLKTFAPGGMYYTSIFELYKKKINLKLSSDYWFDTDLQSPGEICILLLSKDSLIRDERKQKSLLLYRNVDQVAGLSVLSKVMNPSLFELFKLIEPIFVVDEAHKTYTHLGQKFFKTNAIASFLIELTATPKSYSEEDKPNIIFKASGSDLIRHGLIKKTIKYNSTLGQDTHELLRNVIGLQQKLEEKFEQHTTSVIPRVLLSVEFTGRKMSSARNSVDSIEGYLMDLGVSKEQIVIKSSERDQLGTRNLDDPSDPAKFILTKTALVEGWDCKSVYIIVLLNNIGASLTNTQIVGRGLRQPRQNYFGDEALNTLYLVTNSSKHDQAIAELRKFLFENGLAALSVRTGTNKLSKKIDANLVDDPLVSRIDFDKSVYQSLSLKREVDKYFVEQIAQFEMAFARQDIEHVQASVSLETGGASALSYKVLPTRPSGRHRGQPGFIRLQSKIFASIREFFSDSFKCYQFIDALMSPSIDWGSAPSDEAITAKIQNRCKELRSDFFDKKFLDLLYQNSSIQTDQMSRFFGDTFSISTAVDESISFNQSLIDKVPADFMNHEELEFARILDSLGLPWLKTTPAFKIDFPYPLGTFYPDFVVACDEGLPTVYIETKGEHLVNTEDSVSKRVSCSAINQFAEGDIYMIFGTFEECKEQIKSYF